MPWDSYNYAHILLDNNINLIITSFLFDQFDLLIQEDKKEVTRVVFPYTK